MDFSLPWPELGDKIFPIKHQELYLGANFYRSMVEKASGCNGEVVLAVCRPDGRLLLHTKSFYPPHTWRLPSGGIRLGESPEKAAWRELEEETGLPARLDRLLGVLAYTLRSEMGEVPFASAIFLFQTEGGRPAAWDSNERIGGYRWVKPEGLYRVATHLRRLPLPWRDWGNFRAPAHDFVAAALGHTHRPRRGC